MKQTIFTIVALMLLLTLAPLPGLARRNDEAARRRSDSLKAEYIYMEAAALQNAGFEQYRNTKGRFIRGLRIRVDDFLE